MIRCVPPTVKDTRSASEVIGTFQTGQHILSVINLDNLPDCTYSITMEILIVEGLKLAELWVSSINIKALALLE